MDWCETAMAYFELYLYGSGATRMPDRYPIRLVSGKIPRNGRPACGGSDKYWLMVVAIARPLRPEKEIKVRLAGVAKKPSNTHLNLIWKLS